MELKWPRGMGNRAKQDNLLQNIWYFFNSFFFFLTHPMGGEGIGLWLHECMGVWNHVHLAYQFICMGALGWDDTCQK